MIEVKVFQVSVVRHSGPVSRTGELQPVSGDVALSRWMPDQVRHDKQKGIQLLRPSFRRMPESSDFV